MKKYWRWIVLAAIIILFFALRLPQIWRDEFPFVFDFGRDLIWVRNMIELRRPTLIGPWGSLAGVYFGPLWYYLLAIPYLIFSGDPRGPVYLTLTANLAVALLGWLWLKKSANWRTGLIFAFLIAISPQNINLSTFAFHANMLPLTQLLFLYGLYRRDSRGLYLATLMTSLNFHFEPATGIFTTLTLILFIMLAIIRASLRSMLLRRYTFKSLLIAAVIFILPFLPNLLFDFRHDFLQTRAVIAYFQGQNRSLEGVLPYPERIFERLRKFTELFSSTAIPASTLIAGLMLITLLIFLPKNKLANLCLLTLLVPLLGFMFLFPPELKGWYLYGFSVNFLILASLFLHRFPLLTLLPITLLLWRFTTPYTFSTQATLKNQLLALDTIYTQAKGEPFKLYIYTPPIYDYQYQYLVWWYGRKIYGYLPSEYSYLPGEVSYHPQKDKFTQPTRPVTGTDPVKVFLLIEPEAATDRLTGWLGHFAALPVISSQTLPGDITLQTRQMVESN
jgi:hypothetical protein